MAQVTSSQRVGPAGGPCAPPACRCCSLGAPGGALCCTDERRSKCWGPRRKPATNCALGALGDARKDTRGGVAVQLCLEGPAGRQTEGRASGQGAQRVHRQGGCSEVDGGAGPRWRRGGGPAHRPGNIAKCKITRCAVSSGCCDKIPRTGRFQRRSLFLPGVEGGCPDEGASWSTGVW